MVTLILEATGEKLTFASDWPDITYAQWSELKKLEPIREELGNLEYLARFNACLCKDSTKAMEWFNNMYQEELLNFSTQFDFIHLEEPEPSGRDYVEVLGKRYRIRKNPGKFTLGEIRHFETLKNKYRDLEDKTLALGLIFCEVDANNNDIPFSPEQFDHIVNVVSKNVPLLDVLEHVLFFSRGGSVPTTTTLPAYSVHKNLSTQEE